MILLGETAKIVRRRHGLSQRAAAKVLGISHVHLNNIENNKACPSRELCDRYREVWEIDLYMLAWCLFGDIKSLPAGVRGPMEQLSNAWRKELKKEFPQIDLEASNGEDRDDKRIDPSAGGKKRRAV